MHTSLNIVFVTGMINLTGDESSLCPIVTFTCIAVNQQEPILNWYFNDDRFARYPFDPDFPSQYPLTLEPENATFNSLVGGVQIQITASGIENNASFLSTMTVNISALQEAGVSTLSCGSSLFNRRIINMAFNSSNGSYSVFY